MSVSRIARHLYQGSVPPSGSFLRDKGFTMLVLCAMEFQIPKSRFPGVEVVNCPLDDAELTNLEWDRAKFCAARAAAHIKKGGRVLVTCHMGVNRSGLVSALVLIQQGYSAGDAIALIRKNREVEGGALRNQSFVRALMGAAA